MQKTLKRTLSLLLAVVMLVAVFTVAPVAVSAAETDAAAVGDDDGIEVIEIELGENQEITVPNCYQSPPYLKFTADKSVCIRFLLQTYGVLMGVSLYDDTIDNPINSGVRYITYEDGSNIVELDYYVTEGMTYYIVIGNTFIYNVDEAKATFTLKEIPDTWEYTTDGTITSYNGNAASVEIPSTLGTTPITAIGDNAFRDFSYITSVKIPEGITSIGNYAFQGCGLTEVDLPTSLESIGYMAFQNCPMRSVVIPENVTTIQSSAFYYLDSETYEEGSDSDKCLQYVTVKSQAKDTDTTYFAGDAFGGQIKLFQCYEGTVADKIYIQEDYSTQYTKYTHMVAYLPESGETPQVRFYKKENKSEDESEDNLISTTEANGTVVMPEIGDVTYGERIFRGWSTYPDDTTVKFKVGETAPIIGNINLYAVWSNVVRFYDGDELLGSYAGANYMDAKAVCADIELPAKDEVGFLGFYQGNTKYYYYTDEWYYSNYVDNHDFNDDGVCNLVAKWADIKEKVFIGQTVSLDDVIRLNFYVSSGNGNSVNAYDLEVEDNENYQNNQRLRASEVVSGISVGENTYDKVSFKIYAKEMADKILVTCSIYTQITNQDGYEEYTNALVTKTYSVKEYLEKLIEKPEDYVKDGQDPKDLQNLCYATLNYGAAAQTYFNHKIDSPANEKVPGNYTPAEPNLDALTIDDGSQADFKKYNLDYYASSLGLFADTSYALCFEYLDGSDYERLTNAPQLSRFVPYEYGYDKYNDVKGYWTTTYDNLTAQTVGMYTYTSSNASESYSHAMVAYIIPNIAAKDLLKDIPIKVFVGYEWDSETGMSKPIESQVFCFSPRTYLIKVLKDVGVDPEYSNGELLHGEYYNSKEKQEKANLVKTVKAIYDYSVKASDYFG